ncbi:prepilin-type N-terminal cleavage/methylation domain-containing protein [Opitutus sp. GAS368]|uniref:PulJ/GspJ family protein n=1 Tax=Opitutus sp. GAS368 TaxID=1882749 RepID=UPI00087AC08F|nr:prepilin-type N-terminal cleavage/methylation domain-containing protein [Opitutus sp. GAS368]SDS05824.1 prepilin-type N-terminal cleavage/methylation domain-containing protein [Opitutus sp. GAS368]
MTTPSFNKTAGFTLVELLIGMSLALIVLTAVLSSYVLIGRNFTRSLAVTSSNQPNLESQGRRTLAVFAQDVEVATAISGTPSASSLALTLPTSSGSMTVIYTYDSAAGTLTRTPSVGSAQILHSSLLTCVFSYYDNSGNPYTTYVNYLPGIKQVSFTLTAQAGNTTNNTLSAVYKLGSPRLLFRNKTLLY